MAVLQKPVYLDGILEITGWSRAKFHRHRDDMHNCGAIYYDVEKDSRGLNRRRLKAFPHRIEQYLHARSRKKGEEIDPLK